MADIDEDLFFTPIYEADIVDILRLTEKDVGEQYPEDVKFLHVVVWSAGRPCPRELDLGVFSNLEELRIIDGSPFSRPVLGDLQGYGLKRVVLATTSLRFLDLRYCGGLSEGNIRDMIQGCPLEDLRLFCIPKVASIGTCSGCLKVLELEGVNVFADSLQAILDENTGLERLSIANCSNIADAVVTGGNLKSLNISACASLSAACVQQLLDFNQELESLTLCSLPQLQAVRILCPDLAYLEMHACPHVHVADVEDAIRRSGREVELKLDFELEHDVQELRSSGSNASRMLERINSGDIVPKASAFPSSNLRASRLQEQFNAMDSMGSDESHSGAETETWDVGVTDEGVKTAEDNLGPGGADSVEQRGVSSPVKSFLDSVLEQVAAKAARVESEKQLLSQASNSLLLCNIEVAGTEVGAQVSSRETSDDESPHEDHRLSQSLASAVLEASQTLGEPEASSVTLAQACVRRFLAKRRFARMVSKNRERRRNVSLEILETERRYNQSLRTLISSYIEPLYMLNILSPTQIESICAASKIDNILGVSTTLLNDLEKVVGSGGAKWSNEICVGHVFVHLAPFFKIYTEYVNAYDSCIKELFLMLGSNGKLSSYLETQRLLPDTNQHDLPSFLIMPVQRIPRYVLLLQDLVRHTPRGHPDFDDLLEALATVKEAAKHVNEAKRRSENMEKVREIDDRIRGKPDSFIAPHRRFVFETHASKASVRVTPHPRQLFLFNDILVLADKKMLKKTQLDFSRQFTVKDCTFYEVDNVPDLERVLVIQSPSEVYYVRFDNEATRSELVEQIRALEGQVVSSD